jgi:branched-chain amino acid transport system substrate-binding protein
VKPSISRAPAIVAVAVVAILGSVYLLRKPRDTDTLKSGVIYAGTGNASFAGNPEHEVLELLQRTNNEAPVSGKRIILEMIDSGGDKDKAISFLEKFSKDRQCVAIIGPTASGESIAVAAKAVELNGEAKIPILSLAASSKIVQDPRDPKRPNEWIFKFAQNDDLAARKLVRVIKDQIKDGKVSFLYSDDGFGKSGADVFPPAAQDGPLNLEQPLRSFPVNLNTPDAIVANLPKDVKALVIWGSAPGPALLVKRLREVNPTLPIFLSHGNASQEFIESVGTRGNGVVVVGSRVLMPASELKDSSPRDKAIKEFQVFWEGNTHKPQSHYAGHAYDAFQILRTVFNEGHTTRAAIRAALERKAPYYGITGTFRFSENDHAGLDVTAFEVYQIQDDHFVPLAQSATP